MATAAGTTTAHTREIFFAGGEYVEITPGDHVIQGQMYVERLMPLGSATRPYPLIFIHGATRTGVVSEILITMPACLPQNFQSKILELRRPF